MDIFRACQLAKEQMLHGGQNWPREFLLVGPAGSKKAEWLDPYFGMFTVEGCDGFVMANRIPAEIDVIYPLPPEYQSEAT